MPSPSHAGSALAVVSLALLAACAAPAFQPDAAWTQRVEALVTAWPSAHYDVRAGGAVVGTMTLTQTLDVADGETLLRLEDAVRIAPRDGTGAFDLASLVRCRLDDQFTPLDVESQAPSGDGALFSHLALSDGRLRGEWFGQGVDVPVPSRVAVRQGLLRLAGLLPREAGRETSMAFLSLEQQPRVYAPRSVRCVGPDTLSLEGQGVPCWRYAYDSGPAGATHVVELWVGDDGRLLRFHDAQGLQLVARG